MIGTGGFDNVRTSTKPTSPVKDLLSRHLFAAAVLAGACTCSEVLRGAGADANTVTALSEALPALPSWSQSISLKAGIGHKDNLLLSNAEEDASGFARAGVEAFLWQLPNNGYDTIAFLNAEETRYFSGDKVDREAQAYGQIEGRFRNDERLKLSIVGRGYHLDQVFDVSDTEVNRQSARLVVSGLAAGPALRWAPLSSAWLDVKCFGKREWYRDGSNDNKTGEIAIQPVWQVTRHWELGMLASRVWRAYESRTQYNPFGRPIANTQLAILESLGEGISTIACELKGGKLSSITRAGAMRYQDNGSGYFDYRQQHAAQSVSWQNERWEIELEARFRHLVFALQTAGLGLDPPARRKDETIVELRAQRKLSERWSVYGSASHERTRCNEAIASYRVTSYMIGVRWTWE